jgi:hypothetical protein
LLTNSEDESQQNKLAVVLNDVLPALGNEVYQYCMVDSGNENCDFAPYFFIGETAIFDEVVVRQNRRVESGFSLSFQLKASTQWQLADPEVVYDLEAKTYNDLILRRSMRTATPCILILLALPPGSEQWLICEETQLRLQGTCYWKYLSGGLSENRASVRIRIARSQRLTPESLLTLGLWIN